MKKPLLERLRFCNEAPELWNGIDPDIACELFSALPEVIAIIEDAEKIIKHIVNQECTAFIEACDEVCYEKTHEWIDRLTKGEDE